MPRPNDDLDHVLGLADPIRRSVYDAVVAAGPAGADRAQVAEGLEISRSLAAYHLDLLADEGLVTTRFEHRGVKAGPGSGRPSKVYERAPVEFGVTLPPRDYELAAEVLADAFEDLGDDAARILHASARARGRRLREECLAEDPDREGDLASMLRRCGYEPYSTDDATRLRNCPFDAIAHEHRELVCSMNLALLRGLLNPASGKKHDGPRLSLEPVEGECCVAIRPRTR